MFILRTKTVKIHTVAHRSVYGLIGGSSRYGRRRKKEAVVEMYHQM